MFAGLHSCSVAVFGSAARNQLDLLSDRDLLLVSDDPSALLRAKHFAESEGWSVTAYSWRRLENSAEKRLLFLEHLKRESIIILDRDSRLRNLLASFQPKVNYGKDINEAKVLLSTLDRIPVSAMGNYWAADILAVGLRTLGIMTLANEGIYCYSFYSILEQLQKIEVLTASQVSRLSVLRQIKTQYRRGCIQKRLSWNSLSALIDIVDQSFHIGITAHRSSSLDVIESLKTTGNWYINSRLLESVLTILSPMPGRVQEFHYLADKLSYRVRNSGDYAWMFKSGSELMKDFNELVQVGTLDSPLIQR